jgi:YD repeat-containing protein
MISQEMVSAVNSRTSGATTTPYHYDTLGRLIAESNAAGGFLIPSLSAAVSLSVINAPKECTCK